MLNTDDAVRAFCGGQMTLGADIGVSLGPIGRHAGAAVSTGSLDWKKSGKVSKRKEKDEEGVELNVLDSRSSSSLEVDMEKLSVEYNDNDNTNTTAAEEGEDIEGSSIHEFEGVQGGHGTGAAIYAYAYQKGLFMSMLSLEGTVIVPRFNVNNRFYANVEPSSSRLKFLKKPTPSELLNGMVAPPSEAQELYGALYDAFERTSEVEALAIALSVE